MDKTLIGNVLQLKPVERMRLINLLYSSLERPDRTIDEIWYDEAERWLAAYKAKKVQGITAENVLGKRP